MPYKALMATAVVVASVSGTAWLLSAENDGKFRLVAVWSAHAQT